MTRRGSVLLAVVTCAALASAAQARQTQTTKLGGESKQPWTVGKTSDGQPDIQGTYTYFDSIPSTRFETAGVPPRRRVGESVPGSSDAAVAAQLAQRAASGAPAAEGNNEFYNEAPIVSRSARRPSWVVFPADGKVPILAAAAQQQNARQDHFRDSYTYMTSVERCVTRGVPGVMWPTSVDSALRIIQGPGYVALVYEMIHEARIIPTDGSPHLPSSVHLWTGDARGHFEGNTLFVDVTNYNTLGTVTPQAQSRHLQGIRQSEALHVIERFTPVAANRLEYEVTIDDPNVYAGPWKVAVPLTRNDAYKLFEYGCHEGNDRFMSISLGAGRVEDAGSTSISESRKAAEQAAKTVR